MKIKKFQGKSFKEVLQTVKREMGADAVILSSSVRKDQISGGSYIEITAAHDEADEVSFSSSCEQVLEKSLFKEIEMMKQEMVFLRESINTFFPSLMDSSKKGLYSFLIKNGVDVHLALLLLEKASNIDELRVLLDREIKTCDTPFLDEKGFVFYGLPGTGKTTTIFKMGRVLRERGQKVVIVSLDCRISSVAYIKEMALNLKCNARIIRDLKELYRIVYNNSNRVKLLIDTPGDSSMRYVSELKGLLRDSPVKRCFLMDASMSTQSSIKAFKTVDLSAVDCIGFTKLDLAYPYGTVYNLSVLSGKPVSFLTSGSAEEARIYSPEVMTNLILGGVCEN